MIEKNYNDLSGNDLRLIEEAMVRLKQTLIDTSIGKDVMLAVLASEVKGGRRDMFSLVRAGERAIYDRGS